MEFPFTHFRPITRLRTLALALAVIALANLLALLMTGPPQSEAATDQAMAGPVIHQAPPAPDVVARSRTVERMGRVFVFISFNTVAISGLAFAMIARRMEARRRERLGLPVGLDEAAIAPRMAGPAVRPRAANEYRPSLN